MIDQLLDSIRREAILASNVHEHTRVGIVTSFDPARYAAKVTLQPEGNETGWLPVLTLWGGNGWGLFCPPTVGDVVTVSFQEGGREAGVIIGRFFSSITQPQATPSGELWMVHQSGTFMKFQNNGKVSIHGTTEIDVGNVGATLHQIVTDAMVSLFNGHTHTTTISGNPTSAPNQTMGSAHLTSILKAN